MSFLKLDKLDQIGFLLACVFAFFAFSMADIAHTCAALMLIIVVISKRFSLRIAKKDHLHWLLLLSILIPVLTWLWSLFSVSEFQADYPKKFEYFPKLFIFILIAYFLRHSTIFILLFGGAFIAGLIVSPLVSGYGYERVVDHIINGQRVTLGTINIISVSASFAIALIFSLAVLLPRVYALKRYKVLAISLLAILVSILTVIIITTETRGVFVGLAACIVVAAIHLIWRTKSIIYSVIPLLVIVISAGLYLSTNDKLVSRFEKSIAAVDVLLTSGLSAVPETSSGLRIHMWAAGLSAFIDSPVLGHGGHAAKEIVRSASHISERNKGFQHLHNSYVDLLARFGVVGLLWYLTLLYFVKRSAARAYRSGIMSRDLYYFINYFLLFWLVINAFESFIVLTRGTMMFTIAVAMIYAFRYQKQLSETGKQESLDNQTGATIKT